jgi:hypothetical protein
MAEPQTQDTSSTPDIASLTGASDKGAISDLVRVQKEKSAADLAITGAADKRMAQDQVRVDKAFAAEGFSPSEKLNPWNADAEHKKFESDPIMGWLAWWLVRHGGVRFYQGADGERHQRHGGRDQLHQGRQRGGL